MLKKITRIGFLVCMMFGFMGAFAQDETPTAKKKYKQEYPRYGFWSNWSLGINGEYQYQLNSHGYNGFTGFGRWGNTTTAGFGIDLEKELNYVWDMRLRAQLPTFSLMYGNSSQNIDWAEFFGHQFLRNDINGYNTWLVQPIGFLGFDFKFNIIDAFGGYKPNRVFSWYFSVGGGAAGLVDKFIKWRSYGDTINFQPNNPSSDVDFFRDAYANPDSSGVGYDPLTNTISFIHDGSVRRIENALGNGGGYSKWAIYANFGTGMSFKLCKHMSYFIEADMKVVSDVPNIFDRYYHHLHFTLMSGFLFHFGATATDLELIAQRALLTQENFDAMEEQINDLESDLSTSKKAEQRLENRVNELEGQVSQLSALANERPTKTNSGNSEEVQRIINQMKADQLNYYAIPFSVLFGNDQWRVPQDQHRKLQAIAKVMEKDTNIKLTLVGFCDYTASDEYNLKLSEKRVKEVKRVLVEKYGVDGDRLEVDFKGKSVPFGDEHYSINRRVSFYRAIE